MQNSLLTCWGVSADTRDEPGGVGRAEQVTRALSPCLDSRELGQRRQNESHDKALHSQQLMRIVHRHNSHAQWLTGAATFATVRLNDRSEPQQPG